METTKQKPGINTAEEDIVCNCCGGTIPTGHRYWYNPKGYMNGHGSYPVEHTNCEDYVPAKRGDQTHVFQL